MKVRARLLLAAVAVAVCLMWVAINGMVLLSSPRRQGGPLPPARHLDEFEDLIREGLPARPTGGRPHATAPPPSTQAPTIPSTPSPAPSHPQETAPAGSPSSSPWLVVGIPSVPRRGEDSTPLEHTLLFRTLESIQREIERAALPVRVVVMNMRPGSHPVFEAVRTSFYGGNPWLQMIDASDTAVAESRSRLSQTPAEEGEFVGTTKERPTPAARRQSYDVAALLSAVAGTSPYYYFAEDDMEFCGATLAGLHHAITKAEARSKPGAPFAAIRVSFGLNGIVLHNGGGGSFPGDVAEFATYLRRYGHRRPPDHLATEFFAQETSVAALYFGRDPQSIGGRLKRRVFGFRYNLARHLGGQQSTIREEAAWSMPMCYTELTSPQVFEVEAWDPSRCPEDDMSPCDSAVPEYHPRWLVPANR